MKKSDEKRALLIKKKHYDGVESGRKHMYIKRSVVKRAPGIALREAHVVIFTICGDFCGDFHHKYLWRFSPQV